MPHIAEQQRGWDPEHTLSVAEALREAMEDQDGDGGVAYTAARQRSKSLRRARSSVQSPQDLPAPQPHLPLRKASAHSRLQSRKASAPKPLFLPSDDHRVQGFHPNPVRPPVPQLENVTASDEHAFAGREARRTFRPARGVLEDQQQTILQPTTSHQADHRSSATQRDGSLSRRPSSPPLSGHTSPALSSASRQNGKGLKSSKSVGDGLRSSRGRMPGSVNTDIHGAFTPESLDAKPVVTAGSQEIRESFRSALTSHSSFGPASSINTTHTSTSATSTLSESFVKVRRQDWELGASTDVDMSVEDAIGMYEDGFESGAGSPKGSLDIRSIRSADIRQHSAEVRNSELGRFAPDTRSLRSLPLERSSSQPPALTASSSSRPATPVKLKRPNVTHRRSQSASLLILGIPRSSRPDVSPAPSTQAPAPASSDRSSVQILTNQNPLQQAAGAVPRDRYGFKKASQYITAERYDAWDKLYSRHLERRSKKWHVLMRSYGLATDPPIRFPPKSDKVKRYVHKGIPPEFRGAAWFWYAGGPGLLKKEPRLYQDLLARIEQGQLSDNDREHIERDLNRTFPDNVRFKPDPTITTATTTTLLDAQAGADGGGGPSPDARKQDSRPGEEAETPILMALRRLLQAFAVHNPAIGYCQSLNFIAGLLLLFLDEDEEKAFVLLNVVTSQHLPGTHGIALEGANVDIAVLMSCIKDSLPALWQRLDDDNNNSIHKSANSAPDAGLSLRLPTVSLATTAWFMSLFVGTLPIEAVLRAWDCLFFEGPKTLFRVALAIFKLAEPRILALSDSAEIFQLVQSAPRSLLDVNALLDLCFRRRGGFAAVSHGLVETRRRERRRAVKLGVSAATAAAAHQKSEADEEGKLKRLRGRMRRGTTAPKAASHT